MVCWTVTAIAVLGPMLWPDAPVIGSVFFGVIVALVIGMWVLVLIDIPRVLRAIRRTHKK